MRIITMEQAICDIIAAANDLDDADDIVDAYRRLVGKEADVFFERRPLIMVDDDASPDFSSPPTT